MNSLTPGGESEGGYRESMAAMTLKRIQDLITIFFNDPRVLVHDSCSEIDSSKLLHSNGNDANSLPTAYNHTLRTSSQTTLKDLKISVAKALNFNLENDDFYFKESDSPSASQFKDDSKSLSYLGLCDQCIVYLQVLPCHMN